MGSCKEGPVLYLLFDMSYIKLDDAAFYIYGLVDYNYKVYLIKSCVDHVYVFYIYTCVAFAFWPACGLAV